MKTIEVTASNNVACVLFVDKITSIKDNGQYRIITLNSDKVTLDLTIKEIMELING